MDIKTNDSLIFQDPLGLRLENILDAFKKGGISKEDVITDIAHIIEALRNRNDVEFDAWLKRS